MGLFVDMDPEEMMMGMGENLDDPDLEAELAAITGNKAAVGGRAKQKGRSKCNKPARLQFLVMYWMFCFCFSKQNVQDLFVVGEICIIVRSKFPVHVISDCYVINGLI